MDVHCILIKIVNGKQARSASSMLNRIAQILSSHTSTDIIFTCILRDCNARDCEYGRRETLLHCCFNAGPSLSMAASVWRLVELTPFTFIPRDARLLNPASFSKSITLRV